MPTLQWPEILLIVAILLLLFGVGKIAKIGGELGAGIKAFKDGLSGKTQDQTPEEKQNSEPTEKK